MTSEGFINFAGGARFLVGFEDEGETERVLRFWEGLGRRADFRWLDLGMIWGSNLVIEVLVRLISVIW